MRTDTNTHIHTITENDKLSNFQTHVPGILSRHTSARTYRQPGHFKMFPCQYTTRLHFAAHCAEAWEA